MYVYKMKIQLDVRFQDRHSIENCIVGIDWHSLGLIKFLGAGYTLLGSTSISLSYSQFQYDFWFDLINIRLHFMLSKSSSKEDCVNWTFTEILKISSNKSSTVNNFKQWTMFIKVNNTNFKVKRSQYM